MARRYKVRSIDALLNVSEVGDGHVRQQEPIQEINVGDQSFVARPAHSEAGGKCQRGGARRREPGPDYYAVRDRQALERRLIHKLHALGYEVTPQPPRAPAA